MVDKTIDILSAGERRINADGLHSAKRLRADVFDRQDDKNKLLKRRSGGLIEKNGKGFGSSLESSPAFQKRGRLVKAFSIGYKQKVVAAQKPLEIPP